MLLNTGGTSDISLKGEAGIPKLFLAGGGSSTTMKKEGPSGDIVSSFYGALNGLLDSSKRSDGILVIIDEFDRISDKTGISSIIKASPNKVKFALVGVSSNVRDLLDDHGSLDRAIADGTIEVKPMNRGEADEIFEKAETKVNNDYSFRPDARDYVFTISRGHPFYIHLVGKYALLGAVKADKKIITKDDCEVALNQIALNNHAPAQEKMYKDAIGHSYVREVILKEFSKIPEDEIHTTELYQKISAILGCDSSVISVYVGQLAAPKYGSVLEKTKERYYRFKDSLFKAYAAARPSLRTPSDKETDSE